MSIVDNFINDLVNEYEVLSDALLVQHSTVVPEHLHHTVDDIDDTRWLYVVLAGGNEVYAELLREKVVDAVDVLQSKIERGLTKIGGGSPCQNLTFRKKVSVVSLFMSLSKRTGTVNDLLLTVTFDNSITSG